MRRMFVIGALLAAAGCGGKESRDGEASVQTCAMCESTAYVCNRTGLESMTLNIESVTADGCVGKNPMQEVASWELGCAREEACNSTGCFPITRSGSDLSWMPTDQFTITCFADQ